MRAACPRRRYSKATLTSRPTSHRRPLRRTARPSICRRQRGRRRSRFYWRGIASGCRWCRRPRRQPLARRASRPSRRFAMRSAGLGVIGRWCPTASNRRSIAAGWPSRGSRNRHRAVRATCAPVARSPRRPGHRSGRRDACRCRAAAGRFQAATASSRWPTTRDFRGRSC